MRRAKGSVLEAGHPRAARRGGGAGVSLRGATNLAPLRPGSRRTGKEQDSGGFSLGTCGFDRREMVAYVGSAEQLVEQRIPDKVALQRLVLQCFDHQRRNVPQDEGR